ncbi:MAG: type VI secretion system membrane subunit TssM, partial [Pseudomonadota bacterium]
MKLLRALVSAPAIILYVALALCLAIWFFGPLIAIGETRPFDGVLSRAITIGVLALLAIVTASIMIWRRAKRDKDMAEDIVAAEETSDEVVTAELGDLRGKLRTAIGQLRRAKKGGGHLYELPWYIIIGPPGAGKTTAIVNSGLQFPLGDDLGKQAIGGVGGTRNCDW